MFILLKLILRTGPMRGLVCIQKDLGRTFVVDTVKRVRIAGTGCIWTRLVRGGFNLGEKGKPKVVAWV